MKAPKTALGCLLVLFLGPFHSALAQTAESRMMTLFELKGMTKDEYNKIGLQKLAVPEQLSLDDWINKALERRFHCGPDPIGSSIMNFDPRAKVALWLDFNKDAPQDLQSGILQRIRAMSDVELVQKPEDADIAIKATLSPVPVVPPSAGIYVVAMVSSVPCKSESGPRDELGQQMIRTSILKSKNLYCNVDAGDVISHVASAIDVNELEPARKSRDAQIRYREEWKKSCAEHPASIGCK